MAKACFDKAIDLLSRRTHFRRELSSKLASRGYESDEVADAIERLASLGYLDDRQATEQFARQKLARGPVGRRRLLADLLRRGAPEEDASAVLDELMPQDDREAALTAAQRSRHRDNPEAAARYLQRQGFSRRAIFFVLEELKSLSQSQGAEAGNE
ncbi:MAG: RecX family transcriptional regulator [Deltaproteobacteria bacterium]|nr:RecX family transcriptional regulator [Deltaproteobacteria bacterium]